ncbi:hypothetical protein BLNAU_17556 [Blattamonas nauphoetae]|uniref:N-acetyltransferase domain-containing protein n=1 Tax=Blattamonas nauphoetae TaxID=2049346 RepID=A0ABQ9X6Y1_9EUKA|nr:hypothetical protein BLNAU_17556 [Blattamonas nauphoetae]
MQVREVQSVDSFQTHRPASIRRQAVGEDSVGYFSEVCGEKQRSIGICSRLVKKAIQQCCRVGFVDVNVVASEAEHVSLKLCGAFSE